MKLVVLASLVTALPFAIANADRPPRRKPPQEAFAACASARQGDTCSVTLREHTITGTCATLPDTSALVCKPDRPPGPPPEAVEACRSASEGDACTVKHRDRSLEGTCAKGPEASDPLACRPASGPPPDAP